MRTELRQARTLLAGRWDNACPQNGLCALRKVLLRPDFLLASPVALPPLSVTGLGPTEVDILVLDVPRVPSPTATWSPTACSAPWAWPPGAAGTAGRGAPRCA